MGLSNNHWSAAEDVAELSLVCSAHEDFDSPPGWFSARWWISAWFFHGGLYFLCGGRLFGFCVVALVGGSLVSISIEQKLVKTALRDSRFIVFGNRKVLKEEREAFTWFFGKTWTLSQTLCHPTRPQKSL